MYILTFDRLAFSPRIDLLNFSLMRYRYFHLILLALLLMDTTYSFLQHYHEPLDGDMAGIIMPSEVFQPLMEDPFALNVLFRDQEYKDPNRFFVHWFMSKYYKSIPFLLQYVVDHVTSIYLASAIMKILIQLLSGCWHLSSADRKTSLAGSLSLQHAWLRL